MEKKMGLGFIRPCGHKAVAWIESITGGFSLWTFSCVLMFPIRSIQNIFTFFGYPYSQTHLHEFGLSKVTTLLTSWRRNLTLKLLELISSPVPLIVSVVEKKISERIHERNPISSLLVNMEAFWNLNLIS